jgi:hypothetical protein
MNTALSAIEALLRAREQTLTAGSARVLYSVDNDVGLEWPSIRAERRGGLLRPLVKPAKTVGRLMWKQFSDRLDFRRQEAEGVIDFRGRRYMLDHGSFAELYAGGQEWLGRSGRRLATLRPDSFVYPTPHAVPTPLWLLDVLAGATDASDAGHEELGGTPCRHLTATIDLGRASQETPGGVAVPHLVVLNYEDLRALSMEVWLDDVGIRRLRFSAGGRTQTLELWQLGTDLDGLDWTRLPTFRSPEEGARLSRR